MNQYKTWGKSRSNRLSGYDYSSDRPVHITLCAKDKITIFNNTANTEVVIGELLKAAEDLNFRIVCYCLMPDHLHVIVSPGDSGVALSKFLNIFKGRTTAIFRKRFGANSLWQRSAFDHVIRADEDLRAVIKYILNNPVRKGIAEKAEDYPYCKCFEDEVARYL